MYYKAVVIKYAPKAKNMAAEMEKNANDMAEKGFELVSTTVTGSAKAIMMFKTDAVKAPKTEKSEEPAKSEK